MARIRSIKPEFPHSESMGRVSRDARLLFIMLWTIADDAGRLRGNSRMLASLLFPYDDDAKGLIDGWIAELVNEECLSVYRVANDTYIEISNWLIHQRIDKPSKSKIPAFDESSRILANPREASSEDQRKGSEDQRSGSKEREAQADSQPPDDVAARTAQVCARLKRETKLAHVNPNDARLIAAVGAGITADELIFVANEYPDKPIAYVVSAATGRRRDAANANAGVTNDQANPSFGRNSAAGARQTIIERGDQLSREFLQS